ncbi:hypothetical protein H8356DRAFT_1670621 [Neocallimastix lanati (nom. inval.)]|nr:hypothetical protein H8356DRAFT_1670621 [Neocallimastix sp. JGI-2020a]
MANFIHCSVLICLLCFLLGVNASGFTLEWKREHVPKDSGYYYCSKSKCVNFFTVGKKNCLHVWNDCSTDQFIQSFKYGVDAQNFVSHGGSCYYQSCNGR